MNSFSNFTNLYSLSKTLRFELKPIGKTLEYIEKEGINRQYKKAFIERLLYLSKLTLQIRNSISNTEIDYLISPVANEKGEFYDSRTANDTLPKNADANGAYNIARKGLWVIEQIKQSADLKKIKLAISNKEWLEFVQKNVNY